MSIDKPNYSNFIKAIESQSKLSMPLGIFITCSSLITLQKLTDYLLLSVGVGWIIISLLSKHLKTPYIFLISFLTSITLCIIFIVNYKNSGYESNFDLFFAIFVGAGSLSSIKHFNQYKGIEVDENYVHPPTKISGYFFSFFKYFALIVMISIVLLFRGAPPTGVLNVSQLKQVHLDYFYGSGLCDKQEENIIFVIFCGMMDFKDSGILLTSKNVVLFSNGGNKDSSLVIAIDEIQSVTQGEIYMGARECIVKINNKPPVTLRIPVSMEYDDTKFISKLQELSMVNKVINTDSE
jgi:hypothetical protein